MAITEGVGIAAAGKEARAKALAKSKQITSDKKIAAEYKVDPFDKIIRDIDRNFKRIGAQESTGGVKETGRGMGDRFDPTKDFQVKRPSFFSLTKDTKVASTDLSGLRSDDTTESTFGTSFTDQASANIADASIYKQKEDNIYRPTDNIYDSLKGIKFPKIEKDKPTTFTDSSGDVYTSKPYTESTPGFKFYGGTDAQLIRRKDDDAKFSQPYSEASNKEAFTRERNAYLRDTGQVVPSSEKTKPIRGFGDALGAALGFNKREEPSKLSGLVESMANEDYKKYRAEMRDKVFSESPYGKDVEKKYYYKDFQQPGVYRSEKEVQSYIKDRGAALTGMPSNFQGGVSGVGKTTDDFSKDSRYQSTAGNLAKEQSEPSTLQKVGNFLGDVTNKVLGIQTAEASQIGGPLPNVNQANTRLPGDRGTTPQSTAAPKQTVASLPSNYKQTESEAFRKAAAFKEAQGIANRNPNVSVGVDSQGQPKATATNDSGVAKAQAAAVNRKLQGKTISQVKAENKKSMQDAARKRNEAFKKSRAQKKKSGGGFGKSTSTTKKSAPKKSTAKKSSPSSQASNKRAQASKKRQAARKKASTAKKSKKSTSKSSKSKSSKTAGSKNKRGSGARGNRGRGRGRGR